MTALAQPPGPTSTAARRAAAGLFAMTRTERKNLRTGLIAGAVALIVFALSWVVGLVY